MRAGERTLESVEIIQLVKGEAPDEVGILLCKNGVLYNSEEELDYQKDYGD